LPYRYTKKDHKSALKIAMRTATDLFISKPAAVNLLPKNKEDFGSGKAKVSP
jgi:hypothetical protein